MDEKDEITLLIKNDFEFLKQSVNVRKQGILENTDIFFPRLSPENKKHIRYIKRINDDKSKWIRFNLKYSNSNNYDVYRYQFREMKSYVYIIVDTTINSPYFFIEHLD